MFKALQTKLFGARVRAVWQAQVSALLIPSQKQAAQSPGTSDGTRTNRVQIAILISPGAVLTGPEPILARLRYAAGSP